MIILVSIQIIFVRENESRAIYCRSCKGHEEIDPLYHVYRLI